MKKLSFTALVLMLLTLVACGWNSQCIKPTSYNLGDETTAVMGNAIVQETVGCLAIRYEPTGLNLTLFKKSAYLYTAEPILLKELIYAGREGDILHITYREYSVKGYARTAFFQHLYYDLKTSDNIAFQENVIQILEANNLLIRFRVIRGWPPLS